MKSRYWNLFILATLLLSSFAIPRQALAQEGGGQVLYPTASGCNDVAIRDTNVWLASSEWGGALEWANAETGRRQLVRGQLAKSVATYGDDLWTVSDNDISLFDGTSWTKWSTWTANTIGHPEDVQTDGDGHPWIASNRWRWDGDWVEGNVVYYDGNAWQERGYWANARPREIAVVDSAEAWIALDGRGLGHITGSVTETYSISDGLVSNDMLTLVYDPDMQEIWAGSEAGGISRGTPGNWTAITTADGLISNGIQDLALGDDIWLAYRSVPGKVSHYIEGTGWSHLDLPASLATRTVQHVSEDDAGNLWVGLDDGTAARYDGGNWRILEPLPGPKEYVSRVFSVMGNIYGYGGNGTSYFDGDAWHSAAHNFSAGIQTGPNDYWFGTGTWSANYLWHTDGITWSSYAMSGQVNTIVTDTQGSNLLVATTQGLVEFDPTTRQTVNTWMPSNYVTVEGDTINDVEVRADGSIWMIVTSWGDNDGVIVKFDRGSSTWTSYPDTLREPVHMAKAPDDDLWVAGGSEWIFTDPYYTSLPGGLAHYGDSGWEIFTETHGLPMYHLYDVTVAPDGYVWVMGSPRCYAAPCYDGVASFDGQAFTYYGGFDLYTDNPRMWLNPENGDLWLPNQNPNGVTVFNPTGLASTEVMSDTGLTLSTVDNAGTAMFPPGALTTGTPVTITSSAPQAGNNLAGLSQVLDVTWDTQGMHLNATTNYTITLSYVIPELGISSEDDLGFYRWNTTTTAWEHIASAKQDTARMEFSAIQSAPGTYQIMGERRYVFLPLVLRQQ